MSSWLRRMANTSSAGHDRCTILLVVLSLVLDLLAFTIPLPLFPKLIDHFVQKEGYHTSHTLLSASLTATERVRSVLTRSRTLSAFSQGINKRWDVVLLGGSLGSLFSFAQFLISPLLGRLADRYGRRPVLLATLLGNIASAAIWLLTDSFDGFLLSRVVGGLSEGNIQLSNAIISDEHYI